MNKYSPADILVSKQVIGHRVSQSAHIVSPSRFYIGATLWREVPAPPSGTAAHIILSEPVNPVTKHAAPPGSRGRRIYRMGSARKLPTAAGAVVPSRWLFRPESVIVTERKFMILAIAIDRSLI